MSTPVVPGHLSVILLPIREHGFGFRSENECHVVSLKCCDEI